MALIASDCGTLHLGAEKAYVLPPPALRGVFARVLLWRTLTRARASVLVEIENVRNIDYPQN